MRFHKMSHADLDEADRMANSPEMFRDVMRGKADEKDKGTLDAADRKALPKATFGLPGQRKYPMPDRSHAANAKARATQQLNAGRLNASQHAAIVAKANKILGEK